MNDRPHLALLILPMIVAGCSDNSQSTLIPAGLEARQIANLTWVLFAFGAFVFLIVIGAVLAAVYGSAGVRAALASNKTIIGLGLIFPAATLLALFIYSVWFTNRLLVVTNDPHQVVVKVTGEQWWWRVSYTTKAGATFESANEIHVPVGQPVVFELNSADVIHSFWVPSLGGKIDMIPGRTTRLRLTAERAGSYRGQCAEYCGGPHALMAFTVIAKDPQEHADWLDRQAVPATAPPGDRQESGATLFAAAGCGACHAIEGTSARGRIGPNLTHLASRRSVGIDQNRMSHDGIVRFLTEGQTIKPRNHMPEFGFLRAHERDAIAGYLLSLR
jgi:cytochrome c oxidase subunit II